jgi:hypothetical protein
LGGLASEVLERALNFSSTATTSPRADGCRDEYLLLARGVAWVRYIPHIKTKTGRAVGEITDDAETYDVVDWEEVRADRLNYDDFLHNPARQWEEVRWVARRAFLTRAELVERFGEEGKHVPLDWSPTSKDKPDAPRAKKAASTRSGTRPRKRGHLDLQGLHRRAAGRQRDDPLKLKDFFPCPKPLLGTLAPDSLVPTPTTSTTRTRPTRSTPHRAHRRADRRAEGAGLLLGVRETTSTPALVRQQHPDPGR